MRWKSRPAIRTKPVFTLAPSSFQLKFCAAKICAAQKIAEINGAGEGNRTLVSALGRPHSTIEPHPRSGWNNHYHTGFSKANDFRPKANSQNEKAGTGFAVPAFSQFPT